jgi:hypothetical protein
MVPRRCPVLIVPDVRSPTARIHDANIHAVASSELRFACELAAKFLRFCRHPRYLRRSRRGHAGRGRPDAAVAGQRHRWVGVGDGCGPPRRAPPWIGGSHSSFTCISRWLDTFTAPTSLLLLLQAHILIRRREIRQRRDADGRFCDSWPHRMQRCRLHDRGEHHPFMH